MKFVVLLSGSFLLASPVWSDAAKPSFEVATQGEGDAAVRGGNDSVGETVKGIITYTRWPAKPQQLNFCFVGESAHETVILRRVQSLAPEGAIIFKRLEATRETLRGCDVAYIAEPGALDGELAVARLADSKWILTIGEGDEFCSLGGMFCLTFDAGETHFATNLDAISRSELRVSPRVLRLSRQLREAQP